ncbi:maker203 [Drosophila busckii]|uniref:Maker203 n=1 Tax=Drosophila busckii TaxID=30019 RepID=A0A0M5J266_DROBS|nr:maker203 [Drosophila busckii]
MYTVRVQSYTKKDPLRCRKKGCYYTTNRVYNLERHENSHQNGKGYVAREYSCIKCNYATISLKYLKTHVKKEHHDHGQIKSPTSSDGLHIDVEPEDETIFTLETDHMEEDTDELNETQSEPFTLKPLANSSLWYWSSPQQQERNFLRRSGLGEESKLLDYTVKTYKFFALVRGRGGAFNVDEWDLVGAALGLPLGSGNHVQVRYMELLYEFEKMEDERLQESLQINGVPPWWDDGDSIIANINWMPSNLQQLSSQWWKESEGPSIPVRNAIVQLIFDKYYAPHLKNNKHFRLFQIKDSWLCATTLSYQALRNELLYKYHNFP